jgi:hypothetical protein
LELAEQSSRELFERAAPPRTASIAPFLCARAPLLAAQTVALVGAKGEPLGAEESPAAAVMFGSREVRALLAAVAPFDFRLLSAEEWEYVARDSGASALLNGSTPGEAEAACAALYNGSFEPDGADAGTNGLGVWGMPWGQWIAHSGDRSACGPCRAGAATLYPWQSDEIVMCFAGLGAEMDGFETNPVRFAVDLPG